MGFQFLSAKTEEGRQVSETCPGSLYEIGLTQVRRESESSMGLS